jgi:hypothetical protein
MSDNEYDHEEIHWNDAHNDILKYYIEQYKEHPMWMIGINLPIILRESDAFTWYKSED